MRLQPRHYLLIGVIVLLGIWNFIRLHRAHEIATPITTAIPSTNSPGWQAFDHAASLKDAPEPQFTPALNALRTQTENSTGPAASDLRNCQMWLLQYRHGAATAAGKSTDWNMLATSHVQSCTNTHQDIGR